MECTAAVSCCFGLRHRDCIVFLCASPFRYLRGYMPGLWRMYAVACPYWAPRLFVMLVLMMIGLGWGRTTFSLQSIVSWPEDGYIQGDIHEIQEQEGVYTLLLDHVALEGIQTNEQMRVRTKSQAMQYARPGDAFEGYAFSIWAPDMDSVWDRAQRYAIGTSWPG